MVTRFFFFLVGFGFMTIGCTYIISYLNLLSFGYTFFEYLSYIATRIECYYTLIGFLIITTTIFYKGERNDKCI